MSQIFTYRTPSGNVYKIAYHSPLAGVCSYYVMSLISRPSCTYATGVTAHILTDHHKHIPRGEEICVYLDKKPMTMDRAKAITLHWICGFEEYRTTGVFPNGPGKYNIVETPCPAATPAPPPPPAAPHPTRELPHVAARPPATPTPAPPIPAPAQATSGGSFWDASLRGDLP